MCALSLPTLASHFFVWSQIGAVCSLCSSCIRITVCTHSLTQTLTNMCTCRTSFHYNPALQTRSFLMLGVISNKASLSLVTRTLRVLEETLGRHEDEVHLLESITICLTAFLPLLEQVVCVCVCVYVVGGTCTCMCHHYYSTVYKIENIIM